MSRSFRRVGQLGVLLVVALVLITAACGRKGDPLPPFIRVAEQTRDLKAVQEGSTAVLQWSYPSLTISGGPLPEVESIQVWRTSLPLAQEPQGTSRRDQDLRLQLIEGQGELLRTLDRPALAEATRGSRLEITDDLKAWHEANAGLMPAVIWYTVKTVCCGGKVSRHSNVARLQPQAPPEPPTDLSLQPDPEGIMIRFTPTADTRTVVERSADGEAWQPITPAPTAEAAWLDRGAIQGRAWSYRVRAVREIAAGGTVLGEPGPVSRLDYPDVYPPEPPQSLVCLPEGDQVRLRWEAAPEAAAYRVFRRREGEGWLQLSQQTERTFEDLEPPVGNLTYAVRSVDAAGNDSETTTCETVMGHAP